VHPRQLAGGDNLVGVRVSQRPPGVSHRLVLERLELQMGYSQQ
jgi:hypothetical protein